MTGYVPTNHQIEDSDAMLEYEHAYLWADPGTGKTVTALEAFRKGGYDKMVILCPKLAVSMWGEEARKHLGSHIYYIALYTGKSPPRKWGPLSADILITTMDLAAKHTSLIRSFSKGGKSVLVIDEAHMLKTRSTKRTKAIMGPDCTGNGISIFDNFDDVWQLTGTPIMRHTDDLWSQLRPGRGDILASYDVETYDKFVRRFCITDTRAYGGGRPVMRVVGSKNTALLKRVLDACKVIYRKLEDVVDDLPDITFRLVGAEYSGVETISMEPQQLIKELNNPDSQAARVRRVLGVAKVASIVKYIEEYATYPLLLGYWHKDVMYEFQKQLDIKLPNKVIAVVDGSTPSNKRQTIMEKFNAGEIDILLGQMQAMGVSWNLQKACSHVIVAEELPSPGMLHQFIARVYRRGQEHHVQVDMMRSNHDIDIVLTNLRDAKQVVVDKVIG